MKKFNRINICILRIFILAVFMFPLSANAQVTVTVTPTVIKATAPPVFSIKPLDTFNNPGQPTDDFVSAVNSNGEAVGASTDRLTGQHTAIYWDQNGAISSPLLGGLIDISDVGAMIGVDDILRPVKLQSISNPIPIILPSLDPHYSDLTTPLAINNSYLTVGVSYDSNRVQNAVIWGPQNNITSLGLSSSGGETSARDINDLEQIVGYGYTPRGYQPLFWDLFNNILGQPLQGIPNWQNSGTAEAINNNGMIIGYLSDMNTLQEAPVVWQDYLAVPHILPGGRAYPLGINDKGWIVGTVVGIPTIASLWTNGRQYNLNNLIPKNSNVYLTEAEDINNNIQIIAYGIDLSSPNLQKKAFILELQ